ncbi:MAG TPA: acyl-CoA thioesterase [Chitinophagaceae bacterium]|jgi:acyl-CoA thioester hydrolase|nr:acyl-CoA thioesterase [Chitinophagaceae bacterium]
MNEFSRTMQIRWSDLDPNFHLRHSVYYDWGALTRIEFLNDYGLTAEVMAKLRIGPILFREEAVFRREIRLGDVVTMNLQVLKARRDFSRWSIQHQILKNGETLAALLTVEGAWMNVAERKLCTPPEKVHEVFERMPRAGAFEWLT